jgi:hypothetical protein
MQRLLASRGASEPAVLARFADVVDGQVSPYDFVPPTTALRWASAAALHGRTDVLAPLAATARRRASAARELRQSKRRLRLSRYERTAAHGPQ